MKVLDGVRGKATAHATNCLAVPTFAIAVVMLMVVVSHHGVGACTSDYDCQPSSCCHSVGCVDITKAPPPSCTAVLCSAGCALNTLDCGGECLCNLKTNVCNAHIRVGMPPDGAGPWKAQA